MKPILRLLRLMRPFAGQVALSVFLGAATITASIGLLGTSADLIARAALQPSIADLQVAIVGVRFFGIARGVFRYLERLVSHSVNFHLLAALRVSFYRALEPLAPARLQDYRSGDLLERAMGDVERLEDFYVRAVAPPVTAVVVTTGMGLFLGRFDAALGEILVGGLLLAGVGVPLLARALGVRPAREMSASRAQLSAGLVDSVQGLADVLSAGQGGQRLEALRSVHRRVEHAQLRQAWASGATAGLSQLISHLTLLAVLAAAIPLVSAGELAGTLLAVIALLVLSSFEAVNGLPAAAQNLERSLQAARRLFELTDAPPAVSDPPDPRPLTPSADLDIRGLSFAYPQAPDEALIDVDLRVQAGQRVALVGPSGSGKSTLIHLLLRFWDYRQGSIRLGGMELRDCAAADARRMLALVPQNAYVFTSTLRQNLLLADPQAGDDALRQALERVGLAEWARALPEGLDTWLGERGQQMSAGERQRLALARALLQNAPLLLLDEPTANLDAPGELRLLDTLLDTAGERGVIWITHRLVRMESMDEIIVLDAGRVVERGTHAQLLGQGGLYACLFALQNRLLADESTGELL